MNKPAMILTASLAVAIPTAESTALIMDSDRPCLVSNAVPPEYDCRPALDNTETRALLIGAWCQGEGESAKRMATRVVDSLDFFTPGLGFFPEHARKQTEGACINEEIARYCTAVGEDVYQRIVWGADVEATRTIAKHVAQDEEAQCVDKMFTKLKP